MQASRTNKKWSREEDLKMKELVAQYGLKSWTTISDFLPGRTGKQCRER